MNLLNELAQTRFIVIARHVPQGKIVSAAEAVAKAGVNFLEITFDPSDPETLEDTAQKVILVKKSLPGMHVGVGTVLTTAMVEAAAKAGAEYCIAPNTKKEVIDRAHALGMAAFPGAYTPCEIVNAYDWGADAVKIFPVQPGEEKYVKNVMTPLSHIPFMVTGGVTADTIHAMLGTGAVAVAAGASVLSADLLEKDDFNGITALARLCMERR